MTGSATHLYFKTFWGHDENFNYYVNHEYPLQKAGTGATCDYILLEENDEIDVGLFTDWGFYRDGAFAYFTESTVSVIEKQTVHLEMLGAETKSSSESGINTNVLPMKDETIRISSDEGQTWTVTNIKTDSNGKCDLTFDTPGTYYVSAGPQFKTYQFVAPPICIVTVSKDPAEEAAQRLAKAKADALTRLQSYRSPDLYREAEQASLAAIIQSGTASINAAATVSAVQTAYNDAISQIDALKTKAQYEAEEQGQGGDPDDPEVKALAEAKTGAKAELAEYLASKDITLYRDEQKVELTQAAEQGNAAIDAAKSVDEVTAALADAKAVLDAVKTDAQMKAEEEKAKEELEEAISNACLELDGYKDPMLYRDAEKETLMSIISEEKGKIRNLTSKEDVAAALISAKARLDTVKTDADLTREEEARKEQERKEKEEAEQKAKAAAIKRAKAVKTTVKVKALTKHRAKVTWKKISGVTGYKVYRATKKNGKYKLIKTIKKAGTLKYTDKKLKKGKKYYYKVRTYTKIDGKSYLGKWSKVKKITAK